MLPTLVVATAVAVLSLLVAADFALAGCCSNMYKRPPKHGVLIFGGLGRLLLLLLVCTALHHVCFSMGVGVPSLLVSLR
jgi:hypothetical protein